MDRQSFQQGLSAAEQADFAKGFEAFDAHIEKAMLPPDRPAADFLDPACRWNVLMDAVSTYFNGAVLAQVSALDYKNFDDTDVNWRIPSGYGALMASYGADVPVAFACAVSAIDHRGRQLKIETTLGALTANQVVITVPSAIIAAQRIRFVPEMPEKIDAAAKLPLGVVDKIFLACDQPEMFPEEGHFFGNVTRVDTGSYHLRPFGRPMIEVFVAGTVAETLEREGKGAGCAFAIEELAALLGSDVRKHLRGLTASCWGADPFARGSYSHAHIGCVGARAVLARPVDDRLFFAGEACSLRGYSSAHGALISGREAARHARSASAS